MVNFFVRRSNGHGVETTSRLNPIIPASPKAAEKSDQRRWSPSTIDLLLPAIGKIDQGTEKLSPQLGNVNLIRRLANNQRSSRTIFPFILGKLSLTFHQNLQFTTKEIRLCPNIFFFSTDLHERYMPFCEDFGPVDIGVIYLFWQYVRSKELHPDLGKRPLVYYTHMEAKHQINAAFLLGTYMMLEHGMSAAAAASAIEAIPNILSGFRDATFCVKDFEITLRDCFMGLQRAMAIGWFKADTFDLALYQQLESIGDLSLIGNQFVAFRGPRVAPSESDGWVLPPREYSDLFRRLGVTTVIRLNETDCYDKEEFRAEGFEAHDVEFADCSCPSAAKIKRFLDIVDSAQGKVAVHCKAGLGRTGTMIALWMMKHRGFSAREAIAWLRLCRPGSVIGPQQHFLVACESMVWNGNLLLPGTDCRSTQSLPKYPLDKLSVSARRKSLPALLKLVRHPSGPTSEPAKPDDSEEIGKQVEVGSRMRSLLKAKAAEPHSGIRTGKRTALSGW